MHAHGTATSSGHGHGQGPGGGHGHGPALRGAPRRALATALLLTTGFMIVEVVVGLWSGSLALLADAGHMLGDAGALGLAFVVAQIAMRPRSVRKTYGYRRAEVLGALLNAVALLVAAGWIVLEAIERLAEPPDVRGAGVLGTAVLGLLVNLVSAWVLSRRGGRSINVRGAMLHVLGDALGSVAAIVAGVLLITFGWKLADPIASLVIAVLLVSGALRLMLEATHVLMEGTPEGVDVESLEQTIIETDGVGSVHDLHVWSLTPGEPVLTAHVVLDEGMHGADVVRAVGERLEREHGIEHVTIQPEAPAPESQLVSLRRRRDGDAVEPPAGEPAREADEEQAAEA